MSTCTIPGPVRFGPAAPPSLLSLRGIRLFEGEGGAGAGGEGGQGGDGGQQQQEQQQGGAGNGGGQQGGQQQQGGGNGGGGRKADDAPVTMADLRALRAEAKSYREERDALAREREQERTEIETLRSWKTQREQGDAIRAAAGDTANAALILDSGLFRREAEAAKVDYSKPDDLKAFVTKFVEAHPEYGQTPALPGSGGPGRHQGGQEVSLEQQLEEAEKAGRMEDVIGLKRAISQQRRSA